MSERKKMGASNEFSDKVVEYIRIMAGNIRKAMKDWDRKIVLPEVRKEFESRHKLLLEQCGQFPNKFL